MSLPVWKQLGKPKLNDVRHRYESANKHNLPMLGTFMAQTKDPVTGKQSSIPYIVTKIPHLNLLGRIAIQTLEISVDNALGLRSIESQAKRKGVETDNLRPQTSLMFPFTEIVRNSVMNSQIYSSRNWDVSKTLN